MRPPGSIVAVEARLMKHLRRLNPRVLGSLPVHSATIEESSGEDDKEEEKRDTANGRQEISTV